MQTNNEIEQFSIEKMACTAFDIYSKEIFPKDESIMCSIHNTFSKETGQDHNCIGCNFATYTELLRFTLHKYRNESDPIQIFSAVILYAYLLVERFEEIFRIIKLDEGYKSKHFQIFGKIRRWANFIKHPKAFIFVHHPSYAFEFYKTIKESKNFILKAYCQPENADLMIFIDQEFVDYYYASDANNSKLHSLLTNKKDVVVIFPNLAVLISELCIAQKKFIEVLSKNEVYREILEGKTTMKDYYGIPPDNMY
jgi:hypothetical protein